MLNRILNALFLNVRTFVAAGVANAIKSGVSDGLQLVSDDLTLELEGPDEVEDMELPVLSIEELVIE